MGKSDIPFCFAEFLRSRNVRDVRLLANMSEVTIVALDICIVVHRALALFFVFAVYLGVTSNQ